MGKSVWGDKPRINFILKRPSQKDGRRTFQVLRRTTKLGERPVHESVSDARIDAINDSLKSGAQDMTACERHAQEVIRRLTEEAKRVLGKPVFNQENERMLNMYWDKVYRRKQIVDKRAAKNRLKRALDAIGELSIYAADPDEMEDALDRKFKGNARRDMASALNQLLKFIGRSDTLALGERHHIDPPHLTRDEFLAVQKFVADPIHKLIQSVAFHAGLRVGEIFALTPQCIQDQSAYSQMQMDRDLGRRATKRKNKQRRLIYVVAEGRDDFKAWCEIPISLKRKYRNKKHSEIWKTACAKAFPNSPEKHIVFKDLRHSFAIHMGGRGVSVSLIAKCLDNSESVCQEYYAGYALTSDAVSSIAKIMEK